MPTHTATDPTLAGRTILVTGGAGFIGSHLVRTLAPENEVRVVDDLSAGRRERLPDDVTLFEGDIRDRDLLETAVEGAEFVFHTAGLVSVEESVRRPVESHERNSLGTVTVLEAARAVDARVVFSSSAAIYGPPDDLPIAESDRKSPRSPYGLDKRTADEYVRLYDRLYDLETVSLRYFNVYGPLPEGGVGGGVVSEFVERARRGADIVVDGNGSQTRDFVHVDDVVRANLLAARASVSGRAYNVGSGEQTSIDHLARLVRRLVPGDADVVYGDPRPGDIDHSRADIGRIASELGYDPSVSLESGLERLLRARA